MNEGSAVFSVIFINEKLPTFGVINDYFIRLLRFIVLLVKDNLLHTFFFMSNMEFLAMTMLKFISGAFLLRLLGRRQQRLALQIFFMHDSDVME